MLRGKAFLRVACRQALNPWNTAGNMRMGKGQAIIRTIVPRIDACKQFFPLFDHIRKPMHHLAPLTTGLVLPRRMPQSGSRRLDGLIDVFRARRVYRSNFLSCPEILRQRLCQYVGVVLFSGKVPTPDQ